jgi:phage terminase large subunit-like protein
MTNISKLSEQELQALSMRLQAVKQEAAQLAKLEDYQPYPKQELFHLLGSKYRERLFSAGNQLGKTYSGASELAYHLTGRYPPWWKGRRWNRPTSWLAGSVTGDVTRDGMQRLLMGPPAIEEMWGTGLLPRDTIAQKPKRRAGIKDAMDAVVVNHAQGGQSVVQFKSFDQGRAKWQANTVDGVWMDEEPPFDVYEEAVTRTNATEGMVFITFTPLLGMSQVVMRFFNNPGIDRVVVQMGIEDVGHYTPEHKARIIASYDDATRDARTRGIPVLGSGRVFNVAEERIKIDPIIIPEHWAQIGGMDFGWDHPFAAMQLAWDRDQDTIYLTREYRETKQTPAVHSSVLRPWGQWLPWMWPHDGHAHDKGSGHQLSKQYKAGGLHMHPSHVTFEDGSIGVEAGLMDMLTRMNEGRFKVFSTCTMWFNEFNLYHRKDGVVVKMNDDLISASRYAIMGRRFAKTQSRRVSWAGDSRRPPAVALGTGEANL